MCVLLCKTLVITKFTCYDSDGSENCTGFGFTVDDDSESRFYDGYESLEEEAEAVSPKNLLSTVGKHFPYVLDLIEEDGGLMLDCLWVDIEDLQAGPENEAGDVGTSESSLT